MPEKWRYSLRAMPLPLRWLLGLIPAVLSLLILLLLPPDERSPYLLAYPAVVLSAWFFGLGAGTVCAVASGAMIEYFVYIPRLVPPGIRPEGSLTRLCIFVFGSFLVSWVVEHASWLRQRTQTVELRRELDKAEAERQLAEERSISRVAVHERESRLQIALEGGHVALWDSDLETGHVLWSDEHYRILGLEPGSVPAGYETLRKSTYPEDQQAMDDLYREAMAAARPLVCEYRVVWPDGTIRWVEAQAKYETDDSGKAVRMLGVMTDITHRKQAEAVLLRTEKLAAAGRLAASIAHEINNPLEAVANLLYLIAHEDDLEGARTQAQRALTEVMRISRITQQTLRFHRQSEAARKLRLSLLIDEVLELFQVRLSAASIGVDRRFDFDPEVECLAGDLRQVFANLVANALDAMENDGRLTIRMRDSHDWRAPHHPGMRITILDTGSGMDAHTRHRIYEPFFTTKKESGTGLGLWVSAQIVERQHGDLHVWSSQLPGRSCAAFSLFLPLHGILLGTLPASTQETTLRAN
jgi:PAS domain S-box-containing protein